MTTEKILDIIAEVYSEDHILAINTNGICGIETCTSEVEIDFANLDELYRWAEDKGLPMKHEGLNTRRVKDNPREKIFAREWKEQQKGHTLAYLLTFQKNDPDYSNVSGRDAVVAATVIQWLGSPVGQCFLRDVSETMKKEKDHETRSAEIQ